ncbi:unnamed protein product [Rhizoctonia solani]|uniref:Uncharacterized protein n=1 Tax=Rhizoctonia solani TaxID=456999 RepID=A0A8H3GEG5_9AGAM|nr:unnamed protein product [Rhizoctonia solani]CAE6533046.1 unnamed protein product [Rhizoctonia solani]
METTVSRQGDFQIRLAQWLLDQLNSRGELETVTQQFSFLVSQVQEQSIEELYEHIGKLIFQKVARVPLEGVRVDIRLCAELCYSLFALHVKHRSNLRFRVMLIHEHIFRLCIHSISAENIIDLESNQDRTGTTTGPDFMSPRSNGTISLEKNSELLFYLCDFRLISLAQICEYMHRVIESHKTSTSSRLRDAGIGIRILSGLFPGHSAVPWKNEKNEFDEWINTHSNLNDCQVTATLGRINPQEKLHTNTDVGRSTQPKTIGFSPLGNHNDAEAYSSGSPNRLVSSDKTTFLSQSRDHAEEIDDLARNNFGKPPQTPVVSRPESPANKNSDEGLVMTGVVAGKERRLGQERGKAAGEQEEGEKDEDKIEEKKLANDKAERKTEDEAKREAEERVIREEAKRKAEMERRLKDEEVKREAELEIERKAEAERKARGEAERVAEEARRKEEALRLKAAALKIKEEEKHKARVLNEHRLAERKAKRETERKAKEEEERMVQEEQRKEAERKAREEAEREAKAEAECKAREEEQRIAQEERARRGEERRVKREAERQARREAEQQARLEIERKAKEEEERKVKEDKERHARVEAERKEAQERAREQAELEAREIEEREAREAAEVAARAEEEEREEREAAEAANRATAEAIVKEEMERERAEKEKEKWLKHLEYLEGFTTPTGRAQGKKNYRMW